MKLAAQIFIMFLAVTAHETAHILAARCFGVKTEKLIFTPLGEIAVMKDLVFLPPVWKALVLAAGPAVNLVSGLICLLFFPGRFLFFTEVNMVIGFFNLIPTYPLDGGRLCQLLLESKTGTLSSNSAMFSLSRLISICFIFLGFVQVILYPFNISLLCMGAYTALCSRKLHLDTIFEFYRHAVFGSDKQEKKKMLPVKTFAVSNRTEIKAVIRVLGYDFFTVFHVFEQGALIQTLTEADIIRYIKGNGVNGSLQNVL